MNSLSLLAIAAAPFAALALAAGSLGLALTFITVSIFAVAIADYAREPRVLALATVAASARRETRALAA